MIGKFMDVKIIKSDKGNIALCKSDDVIIHDGQPALGFIANIGYSHHYRRIVLNKAAVCKSFFDIYTGIAGEVAQKFVNYGIRVAISGNFSTYKSKALKDYIYECNNVGFPYFTGNEDEAVKKLGGETIGGMKG